MTAKELSELPIRVETNTVSDKEMVEYCYSYRSSIDILIHYPRKNGKFTGRNYRTYRRKGRNYDTAERLISAINNER